MERNAYLRQCYRFLNNFRLCANVRKSDGHQELEMCEFDPQIADINAPCTCRDPTRIQCIHTAVYVSEDKVVTDAEGKISTKEKERLGKVVSSEGKEIRLPVEVKFDAFKMWTAGIAEANEEAFIILGQLDEINRAYPIQKPLLAHAAKYDPQIFEKVIDKIRTECIYNNQIHKPCIIANITPILEATNIQKSSNMYLKALKLLDTADPVKEIVLSNMNLQKIPEEIADFKNLATLRIAENKITTIPPEILALPKLKEIDLTNNNITTIPQSLRSAKHAIAIKFDKNPVIDTPFETLKNNLMQICTVDGVVNKNCVLPISSSIAENASTNQNVNQLLNALALENTVYPVKKLEIDFEARQIPNNIGELTALETLIITNANLETVPEEIGDLKKLKTIDISANDIEMLPESFWNLTELTNINISQNKIREISPKIGQMKHLKTFRAETNEINVIPETFKELKNLKEIELAHNNIEIINPLSGLTMLQKLTLEENNIKTIPNEFGTLLNLRELSMSGNHLETIAPSFANLSKMKKLDLSNNELTNVDPVWQLTNLEELVLSMNKLTTIPDAVENLKKLRDIDISSNDLKSISPKIASLTKIEEFGLDSEKMQLFPKEMQENEDILHY